jgi:hypothetical protein
MLKSLISPMFLEQRKLIPREKSWSRPNSHYDDEGKRFVVRKVRAKVYRIFKNNVAATEEMTLGACKRWMAENKERLK